MANLQILRMVKARGKAIGLPESTCCHTFRATGITAYLENGGTIEKAQAIAAHASPRTTKLYDRTSDVLTSGRDREDWDLTQEQKLGCKGWSVFASA